MTLLIDGDNIHYNVWPKAVTAFRSKYEDIAVTLYQLQKNCIPKLKRTVEENNINLIEVVPDTKESTDIHIVYTVASNPDEQYFIFSNDRGFKALEYLNPNITILHSPVVQPLYLTKALTKLRKLILKNGKMHKCEAGALLSPSKYKYKSITAMLKHNNNFTMDGAWITLTTLKDT